MFIRPQEAQRTLYESLCGVWKGYEPPGVDLCLDYRQRFLLSSMMALAPRQVTTSHIYIIAHIQICRERDTDMFRERESSHGKYGRAKPGERPSSLWLANSGATGFPRSGQTDMVLTPLSRLSGCGCVSRTCCAPSGRSAVVTWRPSCSTTPSSSTSTTPTHASSRYVGPSFEHLNPKRS